MNEVYSFLISRKIYAIFTIAYRSKEEYINYLTDFCNMRNILRSTLNHLSFVLEDISSSAKEDQKTAWHHPSATS
jgi:hypothetical protein